MEYVVIKSEGFIESKWMQENLGGPIASKDSFDAAIFLPKMLKYKTATTRGYGFTGPGWSIWHRLIVDNSGEFNWITVGEFENKEQAVLFELRWSK